MAGYKLTIKLSAAKELAAVGHKNDRQRLSATISKLSEDPRPAACRKLAGHQTRYRVRQGEYRVVYAIDEAARVVDVVKIGHRREVYDRHS